MAATKAPFGLQLSSATSKAKPKGKVPEHLYINCISTNIQKEITQVSKQKLFG
jgi:hypothetical protein